ncbi:MAG: phosphoenolpyruvate carboxylase [archaeon]
MTKFLVSRTMSTQHPDNVRPPFFSDSAILGGDDEVKEAFYTFSHINSKEQLWDFEGKQVDNFVVKKLFTKYEPFFRKHRLGKDFFLTLRVPNPEVEKDEAKILLETLESIPRNFDIARKFYGEDIPPIFEVAQPMTTNVKSLIRIAEYYKKLVVGTQNTRLFPKDITIKEWIGRFGPEKIRVIPLFESKEAILNADKMTEEFIRSQKINDYQRVWFARSDPAINYGSLAGALINKIGFQKLHILEEKSSVDILPIIGCGSAPFRGNLKPTNAKHILKGYPSVQTYTIQSAFKYDYPEKEVTNAVEELNNSKRSAPVIVDEKKALEILGRSTKEYQKQMLLLAPLVSDFTSHIPKRRERKLHIGLFSYSRKTNGVILPRAIPFCASLYSLGLPPELLGLNALKEKDFEFLRTIYPNIDEDMKDSLQFVNSANFGFFPREIIKKLKPVIERFNFEIDEKHKKISQIILEDYNKKNFVSLSENINRAGSIRGFLG